MADTSGMSTQFCMHACRHCPACKTYTLNRPINNTQKYNFPTRIYLKSPSQHRCLESKECKQ